MKIAVCISGHLVQKEGRVSVIEIAQNIQVFFKEISFDVDYFLYLSTDENTNEEIVDFYNNFPRTVSKKVFKDQPLDVDIDQYDYKRNETNIERTFKMFQKIYACNQLKEENEKKYNFKYDIVFRIRPDMSFLKDRAKDLIPTISNIKESTVYIPKFPWLITQHTQSDFFAFGNSSSMNIYSDTYLNINDLYKVNVLFHPETLLGYQLYKNRIQVVNIEPVCFFSEQNRTLYGHEGKEEKYFSPYFIVLYFKYLCNSYRVKLP